MHIYIDPSLVLLVLVLRPWRYLEPKNGFLRNRQVRRKIRLKGKIVL